MAQRILVWDLPTRIFHWMFALSFAGAFLTGESERWQDTHVQLGYTVLGLIIFRLAWGFVGSRYARFTDFVCNPTAVLRYLAQLGNEHTDHFLGHNPAGAVVILILLLFGIISGISGWMIYEKIGSDWLEQLHEHISNAMLALVFVHIVGVLVSSYMQEENLIFAMITGKKRGEAYQAISRSYPLVAMLLLTVLIGFWVWPVLKGEMWFYDAVNRLTQLLDIVE